MSMESTGDYFENVETVHDMYPTVILLASEETESIQSGKKWWENPDWEKGYFVSLKKCFESQSCLQVNIMLMI
jgi:hypothetical protein